MQRCRGHHRDGRFVQRVAFDARQPSFAVDVDRHDPVLGSAGRGPGVEGGGQRGHRDGVGGLQQHFGEARFVQGGMLWRHQHPAVVGEQGNEAVGRDVDAAHCQGQVAQQHVERDDVLVTVLVRPRHGGGHARLVRGEEGVGRRPVGMLSGRIRSVCVAVPRRMRGTVAGVAVGLGVGVARGELEPGALARIVAARFQVVVDGAAAGVAHDATDVARQRHGVGDAVHPGAVGQLQQQELAAVVAGQQHRGNYRDVRQVGHEPGVEGVDVLQVDPAVGGADLRELEVVLDPFEDRHQPTMHMAAHLQQLAARDLGDVGLHGQRLHQHQEGAGQHADQRQPPPRQRAADAAATHEAVPRRPAAGAAGRAALDS